MNNDLHLTDPPAKAATHRSGDLLEYIAFVCFLKNESRQVIVLKTDKWKC